MEVLQDMNANFAGLKTEFDSFRIEINERLKSIEELSQQPPHTHIPTPTKARTAVNISHNPPLSLDLERRASATPKYSRVNP